MSYQKKSRIWKNSQSFPRVIRKGQLDIKAVARRKSNIKDRVKTITGVDDVGWNNSDLSLAIYYDPTRITLETLKSEVNIMVGHLVAAGSIEKIIFYSV